MNLLESQWLDFVRRAYAEGCEASIDDLVEVLANPGTSPLLVHRLLIEECAKWSITVSPDLHQGSSREVRLFRHRPRIANCPVGELSLGENAQQEFKTSLWYDHKRSVNDPSATLERLKSDSVVHASLKTIAGFLNANGGVLWIGVDDAAVAVGIHFDLSLFGKSLDDIDSYELMFRQLIVGRFLDGESIDGYLDVTFHQQDGVCVARVDVTRRRRLSFLRDIDTKEYELYARRGNLTRKYKIESIEEFINHRRTAFD